MLCRLRESNQFLKTPYSETADRHWEIFYRARSYREIETFIIKLVNKAIGTKSNPIQLKFLLSHAKCVCKTSGSSISNFVRFFLNKNKFALSISWRVDWKTICNKPVLMIVFWVLCYFLWLSVNLRLILYKINWNLHLFLRSCLSS